MSTLKVKNKEIAPQYLIGTLDKDGEFWCCYEGLDKAHALQKAEDENQALKFKTNMVQEWIVVKQTTTFEQVTD